MARRFKKKIPRRRRFRTRRRRTTIAQIVNRQIARKSETKSKTLVDEVGSGFMAFAAINTLTDIPQGNSQDRRIGNEIDVIGIKQQAYYVNLNTAEPVYVREVGVWLSKQGGTLDVTSASPLFQDDNGVVLTYDAIKNTRVSMTYKINRLYCTPVYDKVTLLWNRVNGNDYVKTYNHYSPKKVRIRYNEAQQGSNEQSHRFVSIRFFWYAAATTDVALSSYKRATTTTVYYKDM